MNDFMTELRNEFENTEDIFESVVLSKVQWDTLNNQMKLTPEARREGNVMWSSGEHYIVSKILRSFGFCDIGESPEIMDAAWRLLSNGYK